MQYTTTYSAPLGQLLLAADDTGLTGLWFAGQAHFAKGLDRAHIAADTPILRRAICWLDAYFAAKAPAPEIPLHPMGTAFQRRVWALLQAIPYGRTTTYGALARCIAAQDGRLRMSAQAIGGAVGRNPISILIPCHRVVGTDGSLTGYAGGTAIKQALLQLEQADLASPWIPDRAAF